MGLRGWYLASLVLVYFMSTATNLITYILKPILLLYTNAQVGQWWEGFFIALPLLCVTFFFSHTNCYPWADERLGMLHRIVNMATSTNDSCTAFPTSFSLNGLMGVAGLAVRNPIPICTPLLPVR